MAESVDADAGEEIEVALAGEIVEVAALAAVHNEGIPAIVLEQIFAL
jgi:hypothetical protein